MPQAVIDAILSLLPHLTELLTVLLLAIVSYLLRYLTRLRRELLINTQLTEDVAEHTNGVLAELRHTVQQLTAENATLKQRVQALSLVNDELRKIVAYIRSHPSGQELLKTYEAQRRVALHDEYLAELEKRLFGQSSDLRIDVRKEE